jgi:glycosyltransferase involved in cell wall biosynthesis
MIDHFTYSGGHYIWTVHNDAPHDGLQPEVHAWLVREMSGRAEVKHLHSQAAARHLIETRGLDPRRVVVTPHGNYLGFHTPWPGTQAAARQRHGLPQGLVQGRRILLLFGRLGAYKGAQDLIDCLQHPDLAGLCLVIAGKQIDRIDPGGTDRVVVLDGFIGDAEVPALFAAADAVVAPYRRTLTSGTAVLALSLGRPVIAPGLFHIAETVEDGRTGFLYDPDDPSGLTGQLRRFAEADDAKTN